MSAFESTNFANADEPGAAGKNHAEVVTWCSTVALRVTQSEDINKGLEDDAIKRVKHFCEYIAQLNSMEVKPIINISPSLVSSTFPISGMIETFEDIVKLKQVE